MLLPATLTQMIVPCVAHLYDIFPWHLSIHLVNAGLPLMICDFLLLIFKIRPFVEFTIQRNPREKELLIINS